MSDFLSVGNTFFTVLGYPMSYIEFFGTVIYLWSVWLIVRRNVLTWPVGIVSVLLYFVLFYQIQLYSDALEQLYYLGASVYGWWYWSKSAPKNNVISDVLYSSARSGVRTIVVTLLLALILGYGMTQIHLWAPAVFPQPASFPYLDALTTIMSFTAMWLMARKHIESWAYWIVVDVIGIWLYFIKDVRFISLLYVVLLAMAVKGLYDWRRVHADAQSAAEPAPEASTAEPEA